MYNIEMYNRNKVCNDNVRIPAKKLNQKEIKEMKSNEKAINTIKTNEKTAPGSSNKSTLIRTQILQGDLIQQRMKSKGKNEYNEYNEYDNIYWNRTVLRPWLATAVPSCKISYHIGLI